MGVAGCRCRCLARHSALGRSKAYGRRSRLGLAILLGSRRWVRRKLYRYSCMRPLRRHAPTEASECWMPGSKRRARAEPMSSLIKRLCKQAQALQACHLQHARSALLLQRRLAPACALAGLALGSAATGATSRCRLATRSQACKALRAQRFARPLFLAND